MRYGGGSKAVSELALAFSGSVSVVDISFSLDDVSKLVSNVLLQADIFTSGIIVHKLFNIVLSSGIIVMQSFCDFRFILADMN